MANRLNDNQLPPFRFGGDLQPASTSSTSSSMSLDECFQESPPQERRPQSANSPCPSMAAARPKPHFGSLSNMNSVRNGSPITSHARRTSNPFMRPRKQFRRSLSMFENPGDVMKPKKEELAPPTMLQSVMDIEEPQEPVLPHFFPPGQNDSIPRISRSTMLDVLDGKFSEHFAQKMIIDCRFEYEYDGGHINGAINYNDKELLATHLFKTPMEGRTLLIFHCEYSAHRAPIMARHIRAEDRTANAEHYPRLTYPEVYILDGGYSGFFEEHRNRCYPQAYVEMNAAEHVNTCEREMGRLRQNRRGLGRAQTFAFGQHNSTVQDSPTAPGRANSRVMDDMLGASPILGHDRGHARRMVSF
jgi:M-phase inducer tyrosine phosphatase